MFVLSSAYLYNLFCHFASPRQSSPVPIESLKYKLRAENVQTDSKKKIVSLKRTNHFFPSRRFATQSFISSGNRKPALHLPASVTEAELCRHDSLSQNSEPLQQVNTCFSRCPHPLLLSAMPRATQNVDVGYGLPEPVCADRCAVGRSNRSLALTGSYTLRL